MTVGSSDPPPEGGRREGVFLHGLEGGFAPLNRAEKSTHSVFSIRVGLSSARGALGYPQRWNGRQGSGGDS